ncbi:hypothetical protein QQM39_28615 [Streptomyces sp. DT2A-34]|uniref:hypothetical protein n=1 Tax=Streptomyces sp. DT2A-34 TaxID=3051182 RepID=UPI00265BEE0D|nr:hypothetical protein [Streptomyces sp. DT2A-34]MDO0914651.1 hypothetical protein [Streptomyces sp. DT2A-34]
MSMFEIVVLSGVLALVVGGYVCVVWAERGGPRWVRGVAAVTLGLSRLVRWLGRSSGRSGSSSSSSSDD